MEKRKRWIAVLAIFLLLSSIVAAAIVIQLYLSTKVKLIIPHDIRAEPTTWDWDTLTLWVDNDTAISTQKVTFTSYGAKPLTLSATVDLSSVTPAWFTDYYSLDWTAEGYEIQPLEILETNFTLTVDVPLVREYMIAHQINETEIAFDIIISASDVPLPQYTLEITTTLGGTTKPAPGSYNFTEGSYVKVTAVPHVDFMFDCWNLDGVNYTINPITVIMDTDHTVTAYFKEAETRVYVDPEHNSFAVGETFTITVVVADVEDLYGIDIQFGWDTSIITYVSHVVTIPVEDYPGGILHADVMKLKETVDETASIPGSEPGTMFWMAYAIMPGADTFYGTGTAFEMTFEVVGTGACTLDIIVCALSDSIPSPIECTLYDGYFDNS